MLYALSILAASFLFGCGGQSGSDRNCVVQGALTEITDRVALAQCGDGSITICQDGGCGGTSDSNNPTTNETNTGPVDSNNRTRTTNN